MANLVKTANLEIEKVKSSSIKRDEAIRKYEADMNVYKGYFSKIKNSINGNLSVEMESVMNNIFLEVDKYGSSAKESTYFLGDIEISDSRIQSLIRQKDAELVKLREELTSVSRLSSKFDNTAAHQKAMAVLQEENLKLKNEINGLQVKNGSPELITSYKEQIKSLNDRIHQLEQETSNLQSELMNLRNETEVRLSQSNFNGSLEFNRSGVKIGDSHARTTAEFTSPADRHNLNSPGIRMVDSQI